MAPIIIHGLGLFLFYKNMPMRYPQWNYITVQSFVFTGAIVSEVRLFKWKKKKKKKNNNNEKMNNWCKGLFNI